MRRTLGGTGSEGGKENIGPYSQGLLQVSEICKDVLGEVPESAGIELMLSSALLVIVGGRVVMRALLGIVMSVVRLKSDIDTLLGADVLRSRTTTEVDSDGEEELVLCDVDDGSKSELLVKAMLKFAEVVRAEGGDCIVDKAIVEFAEFVGAEIVLCAVVLMVCDVVELVEFTLEPHDGCAAMPSSVVTGLHPGRVVRLPLIGSLITSGA